MQMAAGAVEQITDADAVKQANMEGASAASMVGERLYAYPMIADNGYFMYYNKYFTKEDVATMDGMLRVAEEVEKKVAMDWSSGWYLYSFFGNTGMTFELNEDGVTNFCDWNRTDGSVKGTDVAEALLAIAQSAGVANMTDADFISGVQDGSVIAGVSGVWDAAALKAAWGNNYWGPIQAFGEVMAAGNPEGKELSELLDTMVEGITASNVQ